MTHRKQFGLLIGFAVGITTLLIGVEDAFSEQAGVPNTLIEMLDTSQPFTGLPRGRSHLQIQIRSVSSDGRFVHLLVAGDYRSSEVLFEIESRRFFRLATSYDLATENSWRPETTLVFRRPPDNRSEDVPFYRVNILRNEKSLLFTERTPGRGTMSVMKAGNEPWGLERFHLYPDPQCQRIFYTATRPAKVAATKGRGQPTIPFLREMVVVNAQDGTSRTRPAFSPAGIQLFSGWSPDGRYLIASSATVRQSPGKMRVMPIKSLYLLDPGGLSISRVIPVDEYFIQARGLNGRFHPGEDEIQYMNFAGLVNDGRRARFVVTFFSNKTPDDPRTDRSSVWDLELESGALKRILDFSEGAIYQNAVWSESRRAFMGPALHGTGFDEPGMFKPLGIAVYVEGDKPRILPFKITPRGGGIGPGERHSATLQESVRFLDDSTLVYTTPPYDLWRYDLRKGNSELLWRPSDSAFYWP
jgi:hypothetical protein